MNIKVLNEEKCVIDDQSGGPMVFADWKAMEKVFTFALLHSEEINGWGLVEREGNKFFVKDVFILKQKTTFAHVVGDIQTLSEYVATCPHPAKIKLQWHSHVNMSVFYSGEDQSTIEGYNGITDYMISMVINQKKECVCRIDLFKPLRQTFEVPVSIIIPLKEETLEFCRKEIKEKVINSIPERIIGVLSSGINALRGKKEKTITGITIPMSTPQLTDKQLRQLRGEEDGLFETARYIRSRE